MVKNPKFTGNMPGITGLTFCKIVKDFLIAEKIVDIDLQTCYYEIN